jgi:hypothetical protein
MRAPTTLDEPPARINLICAIDGEIEAVDPFKWSYPQAFAAGGCRRGR